MARSRITPVAVLAACVASVYLCTLAPTFVAPPSSNPVQEIDVRVGAAAFAGLMPLAIEQPASAYDSVVAMLESWLVGGTVLCLIFAAVLFAAAANPLTKRRKEIEAEFGKSERRSRRSCRRWR